jgi:hypothetical protein
VGCGVVFAGKARENNTTFPQLLRKYEINLFWRVIQAQSVTADSHNENMPGVDHTQPVAQPPDQGIKGLFGNAKRFLLTPDGVDQILALDHFSSLVIQGLQQAELGDRKGRQDFTLAYPNPP